MRHTISIFILLSIIWLLNSGHYTPLITSLGLVSVLFVVWLSHKMDVVDHESQPVHLTARLPGYYLWLFVKIVRANIDVVSHIWRPTLAITPCVATLPASQKSDMGRVLYANSITLTPGTVAMNLEDNSVQVHSLTRENLAELEQGDMGNRVTALDVGSV